MLSSEDDVSTMDVRQKSRENKLHGNRDGSIGMFEESSDCDGIDSSFACRLSRCHFPVSIFPVFVCPIDLLQFDPLVARDQISSMTGIAKTREEEEGTTRLTLPSFMGSTLRIFASPPL